MKPSQGGGIPMYNNNFNVDSENSYNPTYPYLHAQPAPRKKTGRKLLKVLGCGLLALVFTATVSVGSILGYVHFVEKLLCVTQTASGIAVKSATGETRMQ